MLSLRTFAAIFCTIFIASTSVSQEVFLLTTKRGNILGRIETSRNGRNYYAFKGIPYAQPPIRFQVSKPAAPWKGIFEALEFGSVCPQKSRTSQKYIGNENCLFLNVFTPDTEERLPVIVYIHGGGFQVGSSNEFEGKYFMDEDVILVTINYRLGALGFLSTHDNNIPGNLGLKDQNLALKWVRDNIAAFGGNPHRITLMGESAGACAVSLHILSPSSKGLFHAAASHSGAALNPWCIHPNPRSQTFELADLLGCSSDDSSMMLECLMRTNVSKILQSRLPKWHIDPVVPFGPVVEQGTDGQFSFLTDDPLTLLKAGKINKVPWVTGLMQDEGLLLHSFAIMGSEELRRNLNEDWNRISPISLLYDSSMFPNLSSEIRDNISRQIRGYYFGHRRISDDSMKNLTNLYSDRYFNHGVRLTALLQGQHCPVYTFLLTFIGNYTYLSLYYGDRVSKPVGVSHGDDLQYFFSSNLYPDHEDNSDAQRFSYFLVKLWSSFASTGTMMETVSGKQSRPWLPLGPQDIKRRRLKWYNLSMEPKIMTETFHNRMEFWDMIQKQILEPDNLDSKVNFTFSSQNEKQEL